MGKVKVVPVEQEAPVEVQQPEVPEQVEQVAPEPEVKEEPVAEISAIEAPVIAGAKPQKEQTNVTCENCGKSMLMKTYKYSHLKLCKPAVPEPPPPPPPEPQAKATIVAKPKIEKPTIVQPVFTGDVSFTHIKESAPPSHVEVYKQAKDQRQQLRVQRVKSLIAQAI